MSIFNIEMLQKTFLNFFAMKLEVLGGLQSMGLHRVRHDWSDLAAAAAAAEVVNKNKGQKILFT